MTPSIQIDAAHGVNTFVTSMIAQSRRALSRMVRAEDFGHLDTGCGADCTGQLCFQSARLLRVYRDVANQFVGIVEVCQGFDV